MTSRLQISATKTKKTEACWRKEYEQKTQGSLTNQRAESGEFWFLDYVRHLLRPHVVPDMAPDTLSDHP